MASELGERVRQLENLIGVSSELYLHGHSTSMRVVLKKSGSGFVALDEGGGEYEVEPEDVHVHGRTILCD